MQFKKGNKAEKALPAAALCLFLKKIIHVHNAADHTGKWHLHHHH